MATCLFIGPRTVLFDNSACPEIPDNTTPASAMTIGLRGSEIVIPHIITGPQQFLLRGQEFSGINACS